MSCEIVGEVKYYLLNNSYYIVGDNSTNDANGITSQSYEGEIVIPAKIKNKKIREIGQRAFNRCPKITRVTIFAKLTAINYYAFDRCENINYINIPQTVKFIGEYALSLAVNSNDDAVSHVPLTVEFNKRKTNSIYFARGGISFRSPISIIYPSTVVPDYLDYKQFQEVASLTICAQSSFKFCGHTMTTTDISQCPRPIFEAIKSAARAGCLTCKRKRQCNIPLLSLFIIISVLPFISKTPESDKKQE